MTLQLISDWIWISLGGWGVIFVSIILLIFFLGLVRYVLPLRNTRKAIDTATERLLDKSFQLQDGLFAAKSPVADAWQAYLYRRKRTRVGDHGSAAAPEEYMTPRAVLPRYNRNLALVLAGVFAGLGILGTFVGLIVGLIGIETEQGRVLESVTGFIGGMSTAFWSSIFGISFSLIWLGIDRATIHRLHGSLARFCSAVRRRLPTLDAEDLLALMHEQQSKSNRVADEQKAILQNLGTDIASALEQAIDRSFSERLTPALTDISGTLQRVSGLVGDQQAEALGDMAKEFRDQLTSTVTDEFNRMAETIREATEWQQKVNSDVGQLFQRLDQVGSSQTDLIERSTTAALRFTESLGELGSMHERLVQASSDIRDATTGVGTLAAELKSQVEVFAGSNEQIREQLATQVDSLTGQVRTLTEFWVGFGDHLQGLSDNLERSVTEFSGLAADKLGEVFHRFDSEMATIVQHLSGTLAEIREITDEFPSSVQELKETVDGAAEPMRTAGTQFGQLTATLAEFRGLGSQVQQAVEEMSAGRVALRDLHSVVEARIAQRSSPPEVARPTNGEDQVQSQAAIGVDVDDGRPEVPASSSLDHQSSAAPEARPAERPRGAEGVGETLNPAQNPDREYWGRVSRLWRREDES